MIDECVRMRDELARLKPRKGTEEAAHYLLMLDIRINYLRFKAVEARYQSASFDRSGIPELVSGMKRCSPKRVRWTVVLHGSTAAISKRVK